MRISDWSSDVCSSDLALDRRRRGQVRCARGPARAALRRHPARSAQIRSRADRRGVEARGRATRADRRLPQTARRRVALPVPDGLRRPHVRARDRRVAEHFAGRSEEHTSELQSLMRISYAVFCLKKKKKTNTEKEQTTIAHTSRQ